MARKIKYGSKVAWMKDYVKAAASTVDLSRLREIKGYQVPLDKLPVSSASIIKDPGGWCNILIRITKPEYANMGNGKFKAIKQLPEDFAFLLDSLAHELAHLEHWEHTPAHLKLQAQILVKFAEVAERKGVKDTYGKQKV